MDCFGENRLKTLKLSFWVDQVAAAVWVVALWVVAFSDYNYLSWFMLIYPSFLTIGFGALAYFVLFKKSSVYLYGLMIGAFAGQISITLLFAFGMTYFPFRGLCACAWIYLLCTVPLFVFTLMFKESIVAAETIAATTVPVTPLATVRTDANTTPGGAGAVQPGTNNDYPPAVFPEAGAAGGGQRQEETLSTSMLR